MKIKVLSRDATEHTRTRPKELQKVSHNADPKLHPFEKPLEYTRALVAVKTNRMFAKPFIRSLDGHRDSVYTICKHPQKISLLASGSADGEVRLWDASTGDCIYQLENAHRGFVRGIAINSKGQFLTAGDDCVIKLWDVQSPTWIPQADGLGLHDSDEDEDENEALDIMRDLDDDEEIADSYGTSKGSVNLFAEKKKKKQKISKSQKDYYTQHGTDEENPQSSKRHGAPIFNAASVLANDERPIATWINKVPFSSISHKWSSSLKTAGSGSESLMSSSVFATSSTEAIQVWDYNRSEATSTLTWGNSPDSFLTCAFNPVEHDILAATASDRSMAFFDLRGKTPVRKLTMAMNCNGLSWNPMEAFHFTVANEDHNLYTFDMRNLSIALNVHSDHVGAVLDVDYSPTGREFVSGSYDKTIRIFQVDQSKSREVYYTKRMQRVFCVRYSLDSSYVFSASDDSNIRVWKANSDQLVGTATSRQKQKLKYQNQLVERYKHLPEVGKIHKQRHVPKSVSTIARTKKIMAGSAERKLQNRMAHSAPGTVRKPSFRKKALVRESE